MHVCLGMLVYYSMYVDDKVCMFTEVLIHIENQIIIC